MISQNLENFKSRLDELIDDVMRISSANDVEGIQKPRRSIHKLRQIMVTVFVSVAKALLLIFEMDDKNL